MSHSSAEVTYRPEGAGHRARTARVDLSRIPDPEAWLTNRLGPLASFEMRPIVGADIDAPDANCVARLDALASRLTASMQAVLAARRAALDALSIRLEAAKPDAPRRIRSPRTHRGDRRMMFDRMRVYDAGRFHDTELPDWYREAQRLSQTERIDWHCALERVLDCEYTLLTEDGTAGTGLEIRFWPSEIERHLRPDRGPPRPSSSRSSS